jgi:hypothetical protein
MGTLQSGKSPGQRVEVGHLVLERSKSTNAKAIKKRLDAFRAAHRAYATANAAVEKAHAAVLAQERKLGAADDAQDQAVERWAQKRIGAGAKRTKPFESIGGPAVGDLCKMAYEREARTIKALAAKDAKHTDKAVRAAALVASKAADAVLREMKPLATVITARTAAIARREGTGPAWEKTFAQLKRTARNADDDGSAGIFAALFDAPSKPRAKKKIADVVHVHAATAVVTPPAAN